MNINTFLKGLGLAVIVPVLYTIAKSLEAGSLTFDWKAIGIVAAAAFVGYIIKSLAPALPPTTIK